MPNLSRRHLVTAAAALPALALPTVAHATACTLPPDLIERFLRMRLWYLEDTARESVWSREFDKRFYAASGLTMDQYRDIRRGNPRYEQIEAVWDKVSDELQRESGRTNESEEEETEALCDERWAVAKAMMAHEPQSIVDLAWQLEAWLIADLELLSEGTSDELLRTFVGYVRALGAVPQPDDPFDALSLADCEDES